MAKKLITNGHFPSAEATLVQTNGSYRVRPIVPIDETRRTDQSDREWPEPDTNELVPE